MIDNYGRKIEYMRISITDRCNLRCRYCMPTEVPFVPHEEILSYEELERLVKCALQLGINRFKITGGEPLVRKGAVEFMETLKAMEGVRQVTLTTNGILLEECAEKLHRIGLDGINVSIDTLDREQYRAITGTDGLDQVIKGIRAASELGLKVKLNCVPLKGVNEEQLIPLGEIARDYPIDVRFIEIMPIGYGKHYAGISLDELNRQIRELYPDGEVVTRRLGNGPARYYHPGEFQGSVGFIDAIHGKFCHNCNRVRLTSEGFLKTCLYYDHGISLREPLRSGADDRELVQMMKRTISKKPREHHFGKEEQHWESKKMSQIGG